MLDETLECAVCFCAYSRRERIPRMLHCEHTFCARCLERLSQTDGVLRSVRCPLCRWITCARLSRTFSGSLWVNTGIWDQIAADKGESAEEKEEEKELSGTKKQPGDTKQPWPCFTATLVKIFSCVLVHRPEAD